MSATWIPVGSAVAIILLGLSALVTLDLRQETAETMRSADRDDH